MTTTGTSPHDDNQAPDCSFIEAKFIELFDNCCSEQRAQELRAEICQHAHYSERLSYEETIRLIVSRCDDSTRAPAYLRERITVQIKKLRTNR